MKIQSVEKIVQTYYYVEIDGEWPNTYRTDGNGNWEMLMGDSWESYYFADVLQKQFLEWKSKND